ncbi:hypothetical protein [Brevibacillus parabrevis]|jgi:hypothetical protein|uniref:Uncharacterized protein n=1 Tax=Brevibacillus parabrevis TaxID=54914 RepID=A0A4Y3PMP8_BREPA|nr:hypothetical protein [Brevibacillus parabrevis]MBU8714728.1 hypothetical protein [Brevibacillus parabrevis]MED2253311.1 hypothetical protein [Brevibacillus parabrevis]RNB95480.1 hypothetical protein EDM60_12570 [Brevibacillus parabrevis]WDV97051.1 hypothetical protein PSE45_08860 [Brevibacillus parabrevis]GEB31691.1 hypothetical protein BPA01_12710 [Brevibacillus parabrevis]
MLYEQPKLKLIDSFNSIESILNDKSLTIHEKFTFIKKINDENIKEFSDSNIVFQKIYYFYVVKHMINAEIELFENIKVTLDLDAAILEYVSDRNRRIEIWFLDQKISEYWGEEKDYNNIKALILDSFI